MEEIERLKEAISETLEGFTLFIKCSAEQGRVRYVPEYEALSIESEEELLSVSLSVNIKEWLRKKRGTDRQEYAGYCSRNS